MRWGLVDQILASATNLALVLLVARASGPSGLGVVATGFATYVICLILHRALVAEPLVVANAAQSSETWNRAVERAVTTSLLLGSAGGAIVAVLGMVLHGPAGWGLILFAPWIPAALLQDLWRYVLFRQGRGGAAAANDATWAVVMAGFAALAWTVHADWALVAAWGSGALAGAAIGFRQTHRRAYSLSGSWRWWRNEAWPLGRWLGLDRVVAVVGTQGVTLIAATLVPAADVGGLRAVQSVFAPLSVLGPALSMPGLPAISAAITRSLGDARDVARRISFTLSALTLGYVAVASLAGKPLLALLFGDAFRRYQSLILPVASAQLALALGLGYVLLLKAARQGRVLVRNDAVGTVVTLAASLALTLWMGIEGAAWGWALGSVAASTLMILSSRRITPTMPGDGVQGVGDMDGGV
jgi:O-antigen/teichoic acid export membrane protein